MLLDAVFNFETPLIAEVSMTSISSGGINQQAPIDYTPIDIDRVKPQMAAKVQELQNDFLARINDLKAQIADNPKSARSLELKGEITRLENAFRAFSDAVVQHHFERGGVTHVHDDSHRMPLGQIQGLVREMQVELGASYEAYGTASASPSSGGLDAMGPLSLQSPHVRNAELVEGASPARARMLDAYAANVSGGVDRADDTKGPDTTDAPDSTQATKEAGKTTADVDVHEMVNLLSSDPNAFMEELQSIEDPQERAAMMTLVQGQLQQINQLFSMVSQFSQAMHDTSKAIISNLRV